MTNAPLTEPPIFQRLHDCGIAFVVQSIRHGDFRMWLGDDTEGHRAMGSCRTWNEVEHWLHRYATIHYPNSLNALGSPPMAGDGHHRGGQAG